MINAEILYLFKWWLVFFLLGISFLPITTTVFNKFIDKGYIFSKILGILFISFTLFILASLKLLSFSFLNIVLIWIIIALPQIYLIKKKKLFTKNDAKYFLIEEIIFFATLSIWVYIKGFNPDIHALEKFMDFGFINSILRSEYLPPRDMWYTPLSINYYYFGHLYTAVVTKLSMIPSFITFNLMLSTIFAFTFTAAFSIGINLVNEIAKLSIKKSFIVGIVFAYILSLAGNLQTIYAFFTHFDSEWPKPFWELGLSLSNFPNSYWYPNATRFIYHTIHEFPSYSFVVADLHGHVLSIPIVLTILAIFIVTFYSRKIKYSIILLIGFLLSVSYMTNAWDGLIYLGLSLLIFSIVLLTNTKGKLKNRIIPSIINLFKYSIILFISFLVFTFIFNKNFAPFASKIGLNCSPNFLIDVGEIGPFIFEKGFCQATPFWQLLILYGFFIFMIASLFIFLRNKKLLNTDFFVLTISLFSFLLILTPEIVYLKDIYTGHFRANTMFKLSYQAYIMLSISSVYAIFRIFYELKNIRRKSRLNKAIYALFIFILIPLIILISIYPYFAIPSGYKDLKNRTDINGIRYLETKYPDDYKAVNWINNNISGQPVILEAQGDSYTDYARISANTGLPTVLGWTVHEWLWRGSYDIPAARFPDIKNLYESSDLTEAQNIINKYDIEYIYIGDLENEKYEVADAKFYNLGTIIFASENAKIFKIN